MKQLLSTKLFIPNTRPELVSRPRLIEQLNGGLHRKLTLISAPAGFGKTTLVSELVNYLRLDSSQECQTDNKIAWISLDDDDNDPIRFLTYFIASLRRAEGINAAVEKSLMGMLQSLQAPPIKDIVTTIINESAAITGRLIIIFDDYHVIESPPINEAFTFLIEHLPSRMHLVIVTRDDPHLPLARLRARGQLTELRAADLRFTSSEIAAFLNQTVGIKFSADEIGVLETHTEGWITGLQLVALSMQGHKDFASIIHDFSGANHFVLDYLLEEVLEQQPQNIQSFLLQTSVLNRLSGPLCDALTGQDNGQETLEELGHANLFIVPLDHERRWYRYHYLFADLLRLRLHQTHLEVETTLHGRASEWYEQNGFTDEAIDHALHANDYARATHLMEVNAEAIFHRGQQIKLRRWLTELPEEFVLSKPDLCILNAWHLFTNGQLDASEESLQAVEKVHGPSIDQATQASTKGSDQMNEPYSVKLRYRAVVIRALIASYRGDVPRTIQYARQALEYLPQKDLAWRSVAAIALGDAYGIAGDMVAAYNARLEALETSKTSGDIYLILVCSLKLAVTVRMRGQLQRVIDICQQQLHFANERGASQMVVVGWLFAIWAEVLAEINDLDEALIKARRGVELTDRSNDVAFLGWSHLCMVRILIIRGDIGGAEKIIQKMENISSERHMPPFIASQISAWRARIYLAQNKLGAAQQWVDQYGLDVDGGITQLNEGMYIVFARILLAQGKLNEASRLLARLLGAAKSGGRISKMIEILNLQALVSHASSDTEQAMGNLEQALEFAEPGGFVRIFVDEGPMLARLLYEAVARKIAPDYTRQLLSAFPVPEAQQTIVTKSPRTSSELVEHLSERELEVLRLVAKGLPRQEIASILVLSLNTVKTHIRNIYGKLGVNNQMQAAAKARALGILESD